jgi:hypothetical protein
LSEPVQIRDLIPAIRAKCGTLSEFQKFWESDDDLKKVFPAISAVFKLLEYAKWQSLVDRLVDDAYWRTLASNPEKFNRHVDKLLDDVRVLMKLKFGVPSRPNHRPRKNMERDARICALYEQHPDWTFGRLGTKLNICEKTVERAVKRQAERDRDDLVKFLNGYAELQEVFSAQQPRFPRVKS